ncbi:hypothetical protein HPB52_017317 [Rhipicephalus sanguineus]|uniref:Uncharacterized protein n=1 Tax=Rhipicephalus sanguineus TaxID=34632 RepID=A0A9D4PMM5_RHISA|nr:hypothetical protein HPB52_017317 [Rhipicephalus sanguineus]
METPLRRCQCPVLISEGSDRTRPQTVRPTACALSPEAAVRSMARMFVPAALWLCATLLGQQHNVQGAPRPVRQISPGLLEEGSTQQKVTQQQSKTLTKPFSHAVDHGPYTATVHATPFMSSGVLGGIGSALGGLHSTVMDGLHGALHGGGMLGGVPGFHTPLTAASHLLSGTFGAVGHHLGGLTGASPLGGLATPLTSPLSALSPALSGLSGGILPGSPGGGMSVLTHTVHYGSSGDMGLAAAEHQHLTSTAHQHSLLASQALAAADAVENAQLQASLARRHLIHKALAHQSLASQAQMMAHNAHARLLQAQAAHTSVMSMYHNGFGQGYPMMGMPAYAGFPVGGYPGGMMPLVGGAMGYAENPLHSIIRKHCTTVRYINGGGGMYPMPLGLSSGIGGSYPYGVHSAMALGHGVGVYGMHGAYGSSPLLAGGVAPLHSGLGMGIAGLHGGYGAASAMASEAYMEVSRTQLTACTAEWDSLVAVLLTALEDFSEPIILSTRPCIRQVSQVTVVTVLTAQAGVCFVADAH